jgi:hypothetical protein
MIKTLLDLLLALDHYGQSEVIEIAKGKYEMPNTFKKGYKQIKRQIKWQKR